MVSWAHPSLHPKWHVDRFSRFCTAHRKVSHYFTMCRYVPLPKCPFLLGYRVLHLTHGTDGLPKSSSQTAFRSVQPFLYGSQIFCCTMPMTKKTSKTVPPPWDFVTLPEEDRSTAIGNMHRKIGKDRACDSGDILTDRQTDTQTHIQTC